jgi:hypothetical protein
VSQRTDQDELSGDRRPAALELPFDLMAICVIAIGMAMMIGVGAGLVWLRLFGEA